MKLNEFKILSTFLGDILVPKYFDYETNYKINAAIGSILFDQSIDGFLKEFPIQKEVKTEESSTEQITNEIQLQIEAIYNKHEKIKYSEENIRTFGVHTSLLRLKNSYEICIFLINLGYYFEANTIIRLIFEQLVYCINLSDVTDEEFVRLKPRDLQLSSTNVKKLQILLLI